MMARYYHYEFDQTMAMVEAVLNDRPYSMMPLKAATAGWFFWSAMAAAGEWA